MKWISTKMRLPEVGFHVLLYRTLKTQTVGFLRAYIKGGIDTGRRYWHVAHNNEKGCNWPFEGVTHWQPLPAPPQDDPEADLAVEAGLDSPMGIL
jgi:hypothetical protein